MVKKVTDSISIPQELKIKVSEFYRNNPHINKSNDVSTFLYRRMANEDINNCIEDTFKELKSNINAKTNLAIQVNRQLNDNDKIYIPQKRIKKLIKNIRSDMSGCDREHFLLKYAIKWKEELIDKLNLGTEFINIELIKQCQKLIEYADKYDYDKFKDMIYTFDGDKTREKTLISLLYNLGFKKEDIYKITNKINIHKQFVDSTIKEDEIEEIINNI